MLGLEMSRGLGGKEQVSSSAITLTRMFPLLKLTSLAGGTQKHDAIEPAQLVPVEPRGILCEFKVHPIRTRTCLERGDGIGDRVVAIACGSSGTENGIE